MRTLLLQRHVDSESGKESMVFSCFNRDQPIDAVDFESARAPAPELGGGEAHVALDRPPFCGARGRGGLAEDHSGRRQPAAAPIGLKVQTFRASNPGSTRWIWAKLRTINPAPIRSTSDSATSRSAARTRRHQGGRAGQAARGSRHHGASPLRVASRRLRKQRAAH